MSPESHKLLELPEMVASIVGYITECRTLFACTLVNKLWAAESTTILWRHWPPVNALVHLDNATRVQYYADKIRSLCFHDGQDMLVLPMFSCIRFPGLISIQVGWGANVRSREEHLLPFLQPSLKSLVANGGIRTKEFLVQLSKRCRSLQRFDVRDVASTITSDTLLQFLLSMPKLKSFHMRGTRMVPELDALALHLACRSSFMEYTPTRVLTQNLILEAGNLTAHPFRALTYLCCRAESGAIAQLVKSTRNLRHLKLVLIDSSIGIFHALAHCRNLDTLSMKYGPCTFWFPDEVVRLAKHCRRIQRLELRPYMDDSKGPSIRDVHIEQIAGKLPRLQFLWLGIRSHLTCQALYSMARCTDLRECFLRGVFDVRVLASVTMPLWPEMRMLCLSVIMRADGMTKESVEALIRHHAPQLLCLQGARDWHTCFAAGRPDFSTLWHPFSVESYWP